MTNLIASVLATTMLFGCATRGANYVPVVDMKYINPQTYANDVRECQVYANQRISAGEAAAVGALFGALLGAVLASGSRYQSQLQTEGAVLGGIGAGASANQTQESIVKRCLAGRGYNILN